MGTHKVIAIGEIVWDCLPAGKQLGGAPLNFAFFSKELGADAYAKDAQEAVTKLLEHNEMTK